MRVMHAHWRSSFLSNHGDGKDPCYGVRHTEHCCFGEDPAKGDTNLGDEPGLETVATNEEHPSCCA